MTTTAIFPELSRSFKAKAYWSTQHLSSKKRKRNTTTSNKGTAIRSDAVFQVLECDQGGIGMFAAKDISCGSLIIEHEEPIVSILSPSRQSAVDDAVLFCQGCKTPLGSLRDHLVKVVFPTANATESLPCLEQSKGPQFTRDNIAISCSDCQQATWCSQECSIQSDNRKMHSFVCSGDTANDADKKPFLQLHQFYQSVENSAIFRLAEQSIWRMLTCYSDHQKEDSFSGLESLFFWKDYGAHPLWWQVGCPSQSHTRQEQTQQFTNVMANVLLLLSQKKFHELLTESIISKICTVQNIGQLLGMLQCNAMEFEYPSPAQQYVEHLGNMKQEEEEEGKDIVVDIMGHAMMNDAVRNNTPLVGSGLYPLLTLANHSCDPNASIDFLQESDRGSMVALRDIPKGDEICITYIPNGDLDPGGDPALRFAAFQPTRTWNWLNALTTSSDDGNDEHHGETDDDDNQDDDESEVDEEGDTDSKKKTDNEDDPAIEEELLEGSNLQDRAKALLEYGFECRCQRCLEEKDFTLVASRETKMST